MTPFFRAFTNPQQQQLLLVTTTRQVNVCIVLMSRDSDYATRHQPPPQYQAAGNKGQMEPNPSNRHFDQLLIDHRIRRLDSRGMRIRVEHLDVAFQVLNGIQRISHAAALDIFLQ